MTRKVFRLGIFLALGLILAEAVSRPPDPISKGQAGRLDDIFSQGRKAFYQGLRLDFGLHPQRFQLTLADAQKILEAESNIPNLYERVINLVYIRTAPYFRRLLEKGDRNSSEEFETRFVSLSREAAALFVQSLFQEPSRDGRSAEGLRDLREGRLQLVLSSLSSEEKEPVRPHKDNGHSSGEELSGFWGLEVIQAKSAQAVSRGTGVRVVVLDSGSDEPSEPGSEPSPVPRLFVPLAGGTQAPWLDTAISPDRSSPSGGWASSLVAAVAPESQIRVFGIIRDSRPVYPLWPAYQVSQGIHKAVDSGTDIILVTAVFDKDFPFLKDACAYAYKKNVVVICPNAAGPLDQDNPEKPTHFPAHYNTTVAVAGVVPGARGIPVPWEKSELSHYTTCAAPTAVAGRGNPATSGSLAPDNAPAAALVTGTAALICSLLPKTGEELSGQYVQRIYEILCRSCDSKILGQPSFHPRTGYGLINADRAVRKEVGAYREKMNQVETRFKKRMEERAVQEQKEKKN